MYTLKKWEKKNKINKRDEIWRKLAMHNSRISKLGFLKHSGDGRHGEVTVMKCEGEQQYTVSESQN